MDRELPVPRMVDATRVLIVDDSPLMRSEIARILSAEGHAVTEAESGMAACALVARQPFDLVTLDIEMPGLSGFETLRILKARNRDLPVVMISSLSSLARAIEAIRLGAYDYVSKPVNPDDLVLGVRRALEQSALSAENRRLIKDLQTLNRDLENLVQERTVDLRQEHGRLVAAYAQLKDLDDLKTKFVTITSHELRTPLTIITSLMDALASDRLDPVRKPRVVTGIQKNLDRLADLVAKITDIGHLSAASVRYHRRPAALAAIVSAVAAELAPVIEERRLTLVTSLPQGLPPVMVDPDRIGQVLNNLLLNAVRFTPDGGTIVVEARPPGAGEQWLKVLVRDSGIGIPEAELERIFDAFFEIAPWEHHHSGTTQFGSSGLGLGLYIARRIVEGHSGRIWAESGRDRGEPGSTFLFTLPTAAAASGAADECRAPARTEPR